MVSDDPLVPNQGVISKRLLPIEVKDSQKGLQGFLVVVAFFLCDAGVHAKTASEVFDVVSSSIVVIRTYDAKGNDQGLGSGVMVAAGVIATNCHVIEGVAKIQVVYRRKEYPATLRHSDWDRDVCTLTVSGLQAQAVVTGTTGRLKVGAKVYAIGAPQGLELTLSEGIISSLRQVEGGQYLQISAPISPGSSGGGLFDEEGRLIGLPTFYLAEGQQLNFAVPVEWIVELPKRHKQLTDHAQTSFTTWLNQSAAFQEKQDWSGLKEHALRWIAVQPQEAEAWFYLGFAYSESRQTAKAIDAYQHALRINQELAGVWDNLGFAYIQAGQTAKAIDAYQQVLRIKPEWYDTWSNLAVAYNASGLTAKAIDAYQQALRINPDFFVAWNNLGNAFIQSDQTSKAIDAYQQALRINSESFDAWSNLGNAYGQSGKAANAIEACQRALSIKPEYDLAWYNLGVAYRMSSQPDQVMEVYKRLKTINAAKAEEFFNKVVLP